MKRAITYPAATIDDNTKTALAKLYVVERAQGRTRKEYVDNLSRIGLEVSTSQFSRWVANYNRYGSAISTDKLTGPVARLEREKRDIVSGWVLSENDLGHPVD